MLAKLAKLKVIGMGGIENVHISYDKRYVHYHRVVADLVLERTPERGRVLDIGCGLGHVLRLVRDGDASLEVTGADPSPRCLAITQQRVPEAKLHRLYGEDADLEQAVGAGYDTIVLCHSLEHTLSPAQTLRDTLELLRPGGHLVLAVPNPVRPGALLAAARRDHYVNKGHAYAWDRSHWMNFLENILSLDVVRYASDEVRVFPRVLSKRLAFLKRIEARLAARLPWLSFSNLAVVRRPL